MSESGAADRPRAWWKEAIKSRRVRRCDAALVGGNAHRDYLIGLGMPAKAIFFGYDAVDNDRYFDAAEAARLSDGGRSGVPENPYLLAVARFAPEKNLLALLNAFASVRRDFPEAEAWDLVLCGDGPDAAAIEAAIEDLGLLSAVSLPGFLGVDELAKFYAFADGFVLPSLSEPWGLVANEAAASEVPLLISERAGCAETLVPDPPGTTGYRFDPSKPDSIADAISRLIRLSRPDRAAMGRRARRVVSDWGPARFAEGMVGAIAFARARARRSRIRPRQEAVR